MSNKQLKSSNSGFEHFNDLGHKNFLEEKIDDALKNFEKA